MARNNKPAESRAGFDFYRATDGWRWRLRASNGNIVATSAEAYRKVSGAENGARAVQRAINESPLPEPVKSGPRKRKAQQQLPLDPPTGNPA